MPDTLRSPSTSTAATTATDRSPRLLRGVLRENAAFSLLSGAFLAIGGAAIDNWVGLNQWILIVAGLGLVGYAAAIWFGAANDATLAATGRTAIAGDVGWIAAAIVVVAATDWLTSNGEVALLLLSVPVALFAIGQAMGLRRLIG